MVYNSISVDLDGVIYDWLGMIKQYFPELPTEPKSIDLTEYMLNEEHLKFNQLVKSPYVIPSMKFYPGAIDFIKWLGEKFAKVYVITSRDKGLAIATKNQLKEWPIKIENVIFEKEKDRVIPDLVYIHVEDDPKQLERMKKFKYLNMVVPFRTWNIKWITENIGDFNVYPYKDFEQAKANILHILEKESTL